MLVFQSLHHDSPGPLRAPSFLQKAHSISRPSSLALKWNRLKPSQESLWSGPSLPFTYLLSSCHCSLCISHSNCHWCLVHRRLFTPLCLGTYFTCVYTGSSPCLCLLRVSWSPLKFLLWVHLLRSLSVMRCPCVSRQICLLCLSTASLSGMHFDHCL